MLSLDLEIRPPNSTNQNVRGPRNLRQILSLRMGHRNRRVPVEEQHGKGPAHKRAPVHNHSSVASKRDLVMLEKLDYAFRRARDQTLDPRRQLASVHRMQTVNILVRNNPLDHSVLVKMVRERKLDEYAVDLRVHVELENQVLQLLLRRHRW